MLPRAAIRDAAVAALRAANTLAGDAVYPSRDTPLGAGRFPALLVYANKDSKDGIGQSEPQFASMLTLTVVAHAERAALPDAEAELDALCEQVENALLTDLALLRLVKRVAGVDTETAFNGQNRAVLGTAIIELRLEYSEAFQPGPFPAFAGADLAVDLGQPFDPAGGYPPPFGDVPVPPPPRASGPDGRIEAGATITLPPPA